MRFGLMIVPEDRWGRARSKWEAAERLGFDHVWTYDHLNWRSFRDRNWFTAVPTLTAGAAVTRKIRVGVLVSSPNFRHPVPFAKDVTTLDDISDGRLIVGLGSGAEGFDSRLTRATPWSGHERAERFAEFIEIMDLLLTRHVTTYEGKHYRALDVHSHPLCRQQPRVPFAIAAAGPRSMRLAARFGQYWATAGQPNRLEPVRYDRALPMIRKQLAEVDGACVAEGRDPATLRRMLVTGATVGGILTSAEAFYDAVGIYAKAGITDFVMQWPRKQEPFRGGLEVLEEIATRLPGLGQH